MIFFSCHLDNRPFHYLVLLRKTHLHFLVLNLIQTSEFPQHAQKSSMGKLRKFTFTMHSKYLNESIYFMTYYTHVSFLVFSLKQSQATTDLTANRKVWEKKRV